MSKNFDKTLAWYRETLGFRCSDEVYEGEKATSSARSIASTAATTTSTTTRSSASAATRAGLNHLSFEAADIDDILVGHEHLQGKGYRHMWGLGRHQLGSQFFDYWCDPWGRVHEHWADTDRAQREERLEPDLGGRRAHLAVGRAAAGAIPQSSDRVAKPCDLDVDAPPVRRAGGAILFAAGRSGPPRSADRTPRRGCGTVRVIDVGEEDVMTLQEQLDKLREALKARIPPERGRSWSAASTTCGLPGS